MIGGSLLRACVMLVIAATGVMAQDRGPTARADNRWISRFEISGGFVSHGADALGSNSATETSNQPSGGRYTLFSVDSRLQRATGFGARLAWAFTHMLSIEGGVERTRGSVNVSISSDAEGAPNTRFTGERLTEYVIDGAVVANFRRWSDAGGRIVPFATAGVGYLREVHEGGTAIDTGRVYRVGGGVKVALARERRHRVGVRADVGIDVRDRGFTFTTPRKAYPRFGVGIYLGG